MSCVVYFKMYVTGRRNRITDREVFGRFKSHKERKLCVSCLLLDDDPVQGEDGGPEPGDQCDWAGGPEVLTAGHRGRQTLLPGDD